MKQTRLENRAYIRPITESITVEVEHLMVEASGDHKPIGHGGTVGDAKQGFLFDDEAEKNNSRNKNAWED